MLPLLTAGITDASTAYNPSVRCTRIVSGSTTAIGSEAGPIFAVHDGWSAVSASRRTH